MSHPEDRPQRLRRSPAWRELVRETRLHPSDLVWPLFVTTGEGVVEEVESMPGVERRSVDMIGELAREAGELGLGAVILFGLPDHKDPSGSSAWDADGPVPRAIREIKKVAPELLVWADVCLCEYTDHGHCGILDGEEIDGDATLPLLARAALTYVEAGADAVAPSDMFDGRVEHIRRTLDEAGHRMVPIVSYAVKYASALYGPFREAAATSLEHGDRRSHQMDPANRREGLREAELDDLEGADVLMVKPASLYLDVIADLGDHLHRPVAAYQVSGEYSMIRAAGDRGWVDTRSVALESLLSIKRAGASIILTYFARDAARWLREGL